MFRIGVTAAVALSIAVALACSGGTKNSDDGTADAASQDIAAELEILKTQFAGLQSRLEFHDDRAQRSEMLTAMLTLYVEDLDGLADELQTAAEVQAASIERVDRMARAMLLAIWPEQLQERATNLTNEIHSLRDELSAPNLTLARESAIQATEMWHVMESEVYLEVGGPQADHGHNPDGSHSTPVPTG